MRRAMAAQDHRYATPTGTPLELDPPWRRSSRRNSRDIYICKQPSQQTHSSTHSPHRQLENCSQRTSRKLTKIRKKETLKATKKSNKKAKKKFKSKKINYKNCKTALNVSEPLGRIRPPNMRTTYKGQKKENNNYY